MLAQVYQSCLHSTDKARSQLLRLRMGCLGANQPAVLSCKPAHPGKEVCTAIRRPTHKRQVSERKKEAAQQIHSCVQCWIDRLRKMIPGMEARMLLASKSQPRVAMCPWLQTLPRFSGVGTESGLSFNDSITEASQSAALQAMSVELWLLDHPTVLIRRVRHFFT